MRSMHKTVEHDPNGDRRSPVLRDADFLRAECLNRGRSTREIAARVGASHEAVRRALARAGVRRRPRTARRPNSAAARRSRTSRAEPSVDPRPCVRADPNRRRRAGSMSLG